MDSVYSQLASAIYNNIVTGLRGYHQTMNISIEQLEQDVADERLLIIKEFALKGILPRKELLLSLNCIPVDCESLERCSCKVDECDKLIAHFEIPQVALEFGGNGIEYIGTTDRQLPFIVYTNMTQVKYNKYRKRSNKKPYVFIDFTPNKNGMNDGFIFNAPLIKEITAVFIPKDPRQLENFGCCPTDEIQNMSFINNEVKRRLTEKYLRWYREASVLPKPNTQAPE